MFLRNKVQEHQVGSIIQIQHPIVKEKRFPFFTFFRIIVVWYKCVLIQQYIEHFLRDTAPFLPLLLYHKAFLFSGSKKPPKQLGIVADVVIHL